MVDSFEFFHAAARDRFTIWSQYTNKRYDNEGSRIDFVLVDEPFFQGQGLDEVSLQQMNAKLDHIEKNTVTLVAMGEDWSDLSPRPEKDPA